MEGRLLDSMGKITDMVVLNVLWILCCVPIVTAGSATTALYAVMLKMVRDEESYVVRSFFLAFKENFKQATIIWGLFLGISGLLCVDVYFWNSGNHGIKFMIMPLVLLGILVFMTLQYVFPILAFFENRTKKVLKNAFLMAMGYLPYTILILAIHILPWVLLFFTDFVISSFGDLVIGFSFAAWVNAHFFRKLFEKYKNE